MPSLDPEHRRLLSLWCLMASGGWAVIGAVLILTRVGLWAFWPVLLAIGFSIVGLRFFPGDGATANSQNHPTEG